MIPIPLSKVSALQSEGSVGEEAPTKISRIHFYKRLNINGKRRVPPQLSYGADKKTAALLFPLPSHVLAAYLAIKPDHCAEHRYHRLEDRPYFPIDMVLFLVISFGVSSVVVPANPFFVGSWADAANLCLFWHPNCTVTKEFCLFGR